MSAPTNHWKLGLFVVAATTVGLLGIVFLAGRALKKDTVRYTSYFDEAVSGLSTGSPVSYRGVTVGNVSEINIAPDRRHVEIRYDLAVDDLMRLGLAFERGAKTTLLVPPELRVQLGSSGVTGTKYLSIDFFRNQTNPPLKLPFKVPENYIPATASTFKSLEMSVMQAADQLPEVARQMDKILDSVETILHEVRNERLPERAGAMLDSTAALVALMHRKVGQVPVETLTDEALGVLARTNETMGRADQMLQQLTQEKGLLTSVQRASDSVGDVAGTANGVVSDVGTTLRDLRETMDAVRSLADALERDSDMLVKGRAQGER